MGIGNLIKSLFGGSSSDTDSASEAAETIEYEGFTIEATPIKEGSQYRTAGFISGHPGGDTAVEPKRVQFIRADCSTDKQSAVDHSLSKARQIIDEQGIKLLDRPYL